MQKIKTHVIAFSCAAQAISEQQRSNSTASFAKRPYSNSCSKMVLFLRRLTASIASQAARLPRLGRGVRRSSDATAYETRAQPAPGVPFHVAIPVRTQCHLRAHR